jgi:hypothetical protein
MNADLMMGCGAAASATRPFESDIAESGVADSGEAMVDLAIVDLAIGSWADMLGFYPLCFYKFVCQLTIAWPNF